ncbi:MAG: PLDc N-terminal domain-containing protein [Propionibacteriaceae bacterium]|jgi:hypothetical protein|nr:PLDc N-terminal domain-containing protein [Propionibacteriaceae bacterium]
MRALPVVLLVAATIYTVVYIVQSDSEQVRRLPKALWLVLVIILPLAGMVAWWIFGRPVRPSAGSPPPTAPDDDPDFLRSL